MFDMEKIINKLMQFIYFIFDFIFRNKKVNESLKKVFSRETVTYLIFGFLTTVINLLAFKIFDSIIGNDSIFGKYGYQIANFIAWVLSVMFAYITNKLWVFESKSFKAKVLIKEIISFVGARVASYFIEVGGLWLLVTYVGIGKMISKILIAVFVIIFNYVFSKLIIFKKKKD